MVKYWNLDFNEKRHATLIRKVLDVYNFNEFSMSLELRHNTDDGDANKQNWTNLTNDPN